MNIQHSTPTTGPKTLDQSAKSGDLTVKAHAAWGMSVKVSIFREGVSF